MIKYLLALTLALSSCTGYHLGGAKPAHLSHVKSIHVPLFENDTLLVRAESHATNSAVDAITSDGTYRIATSSTAPGALNHHSTPTVARSYQKRVGYTPQGRPARVGSGLGQVLGLFR